MYASLNREQVLSSSVPGNTKYTDYLKSLSGVSDGRIYDGGGGSSGKNNFQKEKKSHPLLPISDNEVKFSNIFSPRESNALKLQLLQKTSSLPILDRDNNNNSAFLGEVSSEASRLITRRRSTASGIVHGNDPNSNLVSRKGDSVANILYSTLRHGNDYDNPSADETLHTGSDSKVDYDPHEPLPPVDQIALRHELLNNIRAISRATYFEDLYTGKVRRNSGSPEAEILRLLENPQEANATAPNEANTIPSKDASLSRVDRWVKESSEASSRAQNNETDEETKEEASSKQDQSSSLYHQSVWKDEKETRRIKKEPVRTKTKATRKQGNVIEVTTDADGSFTESDVETASAYMARTSQHKTTKYVNQKPSNNSSLTSNDKSTTKTFSRNTDRVDGSSIGKYLPPTTSGLIDPTSQYLQSKYLSPSVNTTDVHGKKRPFSFGRNGLDGGSPLSISLPNVAQNKSYISTPVALHDHHNTSSYKTHSYSRPENLNHTPSYTASKASFGKLKKRENYKNAEQVRRMPPPQQQHQQQHHPGPRRMAAPSNRGGGGVIRVVSKPERKVPGIYARLHMNQWVMKKVCFYVNGDEHYPKFEYRFRHGKDIRDLDQLLDLLTKRFPVLPTGARHIFTMDGYPINSLEELENEESYVVSSTRKFKALKYGGESSDNDNYGVIPDLKRTSKKNGKPVSRLHKPLGRQLSASDGNLHQRGLGNKGSLMMQNNSVSSLNSKSVSDVPKLVAHVIHEASSSSTSTSSPMARQPIRVINGSKPSMQSQVLLNTKTSQPFEDLVRDLALSVRIPKQPLGSRLETLAGRPIRSYSQLRSELKAGQRAFYIYSDEERIDNMLSVNNLNKTATNNKGNRSKNGKPIVKAMLGKVNSNSSSELSAPSPSVEPRQRRNRRRSHTPSPRSMSRASHARPPFALQDEWK